MQSRNEFAVCYGRQDTMVEICEENHFQSAPKLGLDRSFTFQRDNDPKHTARVVWEWLLYNGRKQVKTLTQSPDLNPIEHLWDYLDCQIRKQEIKTKNDPSGGVAENTIFCLSKFSKICAI
ncbi:transposable element Tc1 transposase [Trichonephila clavipes]|uniref:Transposable element Tc1 transposase n=1 Tax=Trichonephila clavipes TaxID=2585209 RepID=A0A8X7BJ91_TRICX|nr:transposable element Tc1 transposase [Trichonephila clavipes]